MKRSQLVLAVLVALLVAGEGIVIAYLARQNFDLKVEAGTLRYKLEAAAKAAPAERAPTANTDPTGRSVSSLTRQVMVDVLSGESGVEKKFWLRVDPRDREASGFARQIADVFREVGWEAFVLDNQGVRFKPGLLLLIGAENSSPSYVQTAQRALETLSEPVTVGTGYVSYYEKKIKETPGWKGGVAFLPEQTYVLFVGSRPVAVPAQ
jgi:hypothetical protein